MAEKLHIEKNSVQATLLIPLYSRVQCTRLYPEIYSDPASEEALEQINYSFTESTDENSMTVRFGALEVATRQSDIAIEVREYLETHPRAAVVNLGCGLDPMTEDLDNGTCRLYNIDLPDVIELRDQLFPAGEREESFAADINDTAWFDRIDASGGAVFFACGLFYYFKKDQVKALFTAMRDRFPGGCLVFDTAGKAALKMMVKGIIKDSAGIEAVDAYFHAGRPEADISPWLDGAKVTYKGYMLGYNGLKLPSVPRSLRLLAKVGDGLMKMKIVKIEF